MYQLPLQQGTIQALKAFKALKILEFNPSLSRVSAADLQTLRRELPDLTVIKDFTASTMYH